MSKMIPFVTPEVVVKFSNLLEPDEFRGASAHKVQVLESKELTKLLEEQQKLVGANKINGIRDTDDGKIFSFKSKVFSNQGIKKYPEVYDSQNQRTDTVPFGGATVRLKLVPFVLDDGSVSFFLNKIQIIDLGRDEPGGGDGGFDAVEGGFVTSRAAETEPAATAVASDDIPF